MSYFVEFLWWFQTSGYLIFFKHFPAAGYIDTMLFVFVWFKISFYFKTLLTKCTRWFDLSSFGSVNTLVAIGNERERFRWNQQHTRVNCRRNSSLDVLVDYAIQTWEIHVSYTFKGTKFQASKPKWTRNPRPTGKPNDLMLKKNDFRKVQRFEALWRPKGK